MKAMVLLAFLLLTFVAHADVIFEDTQASKPPREKPVKTDTAVTTTTTAASATEGTTAATTSTAATVTTAPPATASQSPAAPAPAPERRRSAFPFGALTAIGIALVVAITASRRRANKTA